MLVIMPKFTRRGFLGIGVAGLFALISGCPISPEPTERYSTTGVHGLNTPNEILNNPDVSDVINQVNDLGYNIRLMVNSVDPPNIEGTYDISGTQIIPFEAELSQGTLTWYNQTYDNYINTTLEQLFGDVSIEAFSVKGEIIRGQANDFTVYSIFDATWNFGDYGTCKQRSVSIIDGTKDASTRDIAGMYVGIPVENYNPELCTFFSVAGQFYFSRSGKARSLQERVEQRDSAFIIPVPECLEA